VFVPHVVLNSFLASNVCALGATMLVTLYINTAECTPWLHLWFNLGIFLCNFETMGALDYMVPCS
jgi:hypothetical protein